MKTMRICLAVVFAAGISFSSAVIAADMTAAKRFLDANSEVREAVNSSPDFKKLQEKLRTVTIDGRAYHVAEGDLLLDEDQIVLYKAERDALKQLNNLNVGVNAQSFLVGIQLGGKIVRWDPSLTLTYCVLRNTFGSDEEYNLVVKNMKAATGEWEATCGVRFQHVETLDTSSSLAPAGVLFPVRKIDSNGQFIAAGFFPNDPPDRRKLFIDPSYFAPNQAYNLVGVLRHELGHVLGFRHEHIRSGAPPECPHESTTGTFDFTKYDPHSVMHYFCGGAGSKELAITAVDLEGSQRVYGAPTTQSTFVK